VTSFVSRKKQCAHLQSENVRFVQSRNACFSGVPYVRGVGSGGLNSRSVAMKIHSPQSCDPSILA
jgi:hypothetical protein